MVISNPNFEKNGGCETLTTAMIRGIYLIWLSELKREQFAEIRELDRGGNAETLSSRTPTNHPIPFGNKNF